MVWYYAEGNKQRGPLSDSEFEEMIANGQIRRDTLVWRKGMTNWQSLAQLRPDAVFAPPASPPSAPPVPLAGSAPPAPTPAHGQSLQEYSRPEAQTSEPAICNNCGRTVPVADLTRFGKISICSSCRPAFIAEVQQAGGVAPVGIVGAYAAPVPVVEYGGFWLRAIARSFDHILISILQMIILSPLLRPMQALLENVTTADQFIQILPEITEISRPLLPWILLIHVAYHALFVTLFSATPGKMMLRLQVIGKEGIRVSAGRAVTRAVIPALLLILDRIVPLGFGTIILMVGYLMVAFDSEKRSLFDRIAGTRVIRKR